MMATVISTGGLMGEDLKARSRVVHFVALAAVLGTTLSLGQGTAYALVLARFGADALPWLYLGIAILSALLGLVYLAFADRIAAERLFNTMLTGMGGLLLAVYGLTILGNQLFAPALLVVLYEITSEFVLVHLALYLHQNTDTLTQKQVAPRVFAGLQGGMVVGGLALRQLAPAVSLEHNIVLWALLLLAADTFLRLYHRRHGISPYFRSPGHRHVTRHAVLHQVREGLAQFRNSELLRAIAGANFCLVIALFTMAYAVSRIYVQHFPNEAGLAEFLGGLLLATGGATLALQWFVTGGILKRLRLGSANSVLPLAFLGAFAWIAAFPTLVSAIAGTVAKDVVLPAIGRPARNALFTALAPAKQGRGRALMLVVVLPGALVVTAALLLASRVLPSSSYSLIGIAAAAGLFVFGRRAARLYPVEMRASLSDQILLPDGDQASAAPVAPRTASLNEISELRDAAQNMSGPFSDPETERAARLLHDVLAERLRSSAIACITRDLDRIDRRDQSLIVAALDSGDARHRAAALELLREQDRSKTTKALLALLEHPTGDAPISRERVSATVRADAAVAWCQSRPDPWLVRCATYLAMCLKGIPVTDEPVQRVAMLKQTMVFGSVATEDLLVVAEALQPETYAAGERIFDMDDPSDRVYFIVRGQIGISVSRDVRSQDFITVLGEGASLGEIGCFDSQPRSATAHVLAASELLALEKAKLNTLITKYPAVALGLLRGLGQRLRETTAAGTSRSQGS